MDIIPPNLMNLSSITPSRLAMYEGMIALAWIDGPIHEANEKRLFELFFENRHLTEDQRQFLIEKLQEPGELLAVWSRITDKQDRAYLLDYAEKIFWADGNYSALERETHQELLANHLASLGLVRREEVISSYTMARIEKPKT